MQFRDVGAARGPLLLPKEDVMEKAKQLSVSLVNKPGRLAGVLTALPTEKVGLRAPSVMDTAGRSTVRFVADDPALARSAMETINVNYDESEVLLVDVPNQTGGFGRVCERLAVEHLNIDYAYSSFNSGPGAKRGPLAVIRVNDLAKAQRVLSNNSSNGVRRKQPRRRPVHAR